MLGPENDKQKVLFILYLFSHTSLVLTNCRTIWPMKQYIVCPICEKYQSRDEQFPELNGEENLVSRLVFFHSIELNRYIMLGPENDKQKVLFI
jgi:hypothetical protein